MTQDKIKHRTTMAPVGHAGEGAISDLADALADLADGRSIEAFLRSIWTPREAAAIGLRWRIVCLLHAGMTQRAIAARLGVSLCKVTRGARELKNGPPAFQRAVQRAVREGRERGSEGRQDKSCD